MPASVFSVFLASVAVSYASQCSVTPGGPIDGPCQKGREFCGPLFGPTSPQFHIQDQTCGENDPNFPLYDPINKLYHHFWQVHLASPPGHGPDIGHAVSSNLVTWAHLPVAVWNDQKYDNEAIFTGSATIVNGVPTMVYPGLCNKQDWPACSTGTLLAIAVPENQKGDPLLTNWTKPSYNPIVESTERDPSTAWQTASGEWRLTNYEGKIFSSLDFVHWARPADGLTPFPVAECPDFFTVPPTCTGNGCGDPPPPGFNPTHVHKHSDGGDWYTFGVFEEGDIGTSGTWTPYANTTDARGLPLDASQLLGGPMKFYASKSFFDPVGEGRRIYWGWALVDPASTQTLPRVTTYHAALQRLIFNPLPELSALRGAVLFSQPTLSLPGNTTTPLSTSWPLGAGNTSEVSLSFTLPTQSSATFGLRLFGNSSDRSKSKTLLLTFNAPAMTASVDWVTGGSPVPPGGSYYMPGVDMPGQDLSVTNVNYKDPHLCQLACNNTPACTGFTYVVRPPLAGSCCLKSGYPAMDSNAACTSGIKPGGPPRSYGTPIPLLPGDTALDVHVFVDNTFVEVFLMEGRVALTLDFSSCPVSDLGMELFAGPESDMAATAVNVWGMKSIWTTTEAVLAGRPAAK